MAHPSSQAAWEGLHLLGPLEEGKAAAWEACSDWLLMLPGLEQLGEGEGLVTMLWGLG